MHYYLKNLVYKILSILVLTLVFSCNKKESVVSPAAKPSIVGNWTFKTLRNFNGTTTINAKTSATINIGVTSYTASQALPFVSTAGSDTYTLEVKGGNAGITSLKEVKTILNTLATDTKSKAEIDGYLTKYEKEGIENVAVLSGISMIVKTKDGTITIPWQLYSIKELTANKLVLALFYGELLAGKSTPIDERLTITMEK
jgi:hypothetical protein